MQCTYLPAKSGVLDSHVVGDHFVLGVGDVVLIQGTNIVHVITPPL
jgi:hypothetical protein